MLIKNKLQKKFDTKVNFNFTKKTNKINFNFDSEEKLKKFLNKLNEK